MRRRRPAASRPELRIDPLTGLKVVLAPERAGRPLNFEPSIAHDQAREQCPLDEGREDRTPPEVWALRPDASAADGPGWLVRAVPNKYPVLVQGGGGLSDPLQSGRGDPDLFASSVATGSHEVIVHSPEHVASLGALGAEQLARVTEAWSARLTEHADAAYVHTMVNEGAAGGASLEHSHTQLYALDFVPAVIARERERFTAYNTRTMGGCLLCDLVQEEVKRRERVVEVDDFGVLMAPFASRSPYELRIVPRGHAPSFTDGGEAVAELLGEALRRLNAQLGSPPPLNLWVRTAPRGAEHFHWHLDIVPRLAVLAGFELGTGVHINVVPPERAAEELGEK